MSAILTARPSSPWLAVGLTLAGLVIGVLLLHHQTAADMVDIWSRSDTFAHCFLVPPISAWLLWRQRAEIASQSPAPAPWMLLPVAVAGLLWLFGELASADVVSQFALVLLLVLMVPAVAGIRAARTMMFPLGFLFFVVPIGDFMLPWLMAATADFTVFALRLTGIPVFREGQQFIIPSGAWSVVEACSGVRYLIASLMVGTLFAYLNYRSLRRRWIFAVVSLVVPIVANWLRAYFIVLLGHYSGNTIAVGADHLIYGWVFFGIVIMIMFVIGARWAQPDAPPGTAPLARSPQAVEPLRMRWVMPLATAAVLALPVLALQGLVAHEHRTLPQLAEPAWPAGLGVASNTGLDWTPAFENPPAQLSRHYAADGQQIGLYVGYYRQQDIGSKLVSSNNMLVPSDDKDWAQVDAGARRVVLASGLDLEWKTARLRRPVGSSDSTSIVVWQVYWVNGRYTTSDTQAKVYGALYRLLGRGDDGAVVIVYAADDGSGSADARLERFVRDGLDAVDAQLRKTRDAN